MSNNYLHQRESLQSKFYDVIIQIYNEIYQFHDSKLSGIKSKKIEEYLNKNLSHISDVLKEIKSEMERLLNVLDWIDYNVAFFGETNSGKSTIIEALTSGNGKSIGDGRKDYTQKVTTIGYNKVNLLDLPGIEGNESKYKIEIENAVSKSHVIFYIIGTNKEPEEKTINKVKNYLRASAKVYSVLNIRGKPSVYKYKKELIGNNENVIIERTNQKFNSLFNNHYEGNIALNGHISFLCDFNLTKYNRFNYKILSIIVKVGNFIFKKIFGKEKDIKLGRQFNYLKENEDLLNIFGEVETAYKYSNIQKLKDVLKTLSDNSAAEIYSANSYKVTTILTSLKQNLTNENDNFRQVIKNIKTESLKTLKNGEHLFDKYEEDFISSSHLQLTKLETQLLQKAYKGIDDRLEEKVIEQEMRDVTGIFKREIENNFNTLNNQFKKEFSILTEELENRLLLNLSSSSEYNQSLKIMLNELSGGFIEDFMFGMGFGFSISAIIGAFEVHWVLGVLATIAAIIINIFNFLKAEAKKNQKKKDKIREKIKEHINEKKSEIKKEISDLFSRNKNHFRETLNNSILNLESDFEIMNIKIDNFLKSISIFKNKITIIDK